MSGWIIITGDDGHFQIDGVGVLQRASRVWTPFVVMVFGCGYLLIPVDPVGLGDCAWVCAWACACAFACSLAAA